MIDMKDDDLNAARGIFWWALIAVAVLMWVVL